MKKASDQMDIQEWEFLSDDDDDDDDDDEDDEDGEKKKGLVSIQVLDVNYFPPPRKSMNQLIPIPIHTGSMSGEHNKDLEAVKVIIMDHPIMNDQGLIPGLIPQVFFNNKKENQFGDMNDGAMKTASEEFQFLAKEETQLQIRNSDHQKEMIVKNNYLDQNIRKEDNFSLNIWKWKVTGIGAFCSIGVAAAATVCIFIIGGRRQSHENYRPSQHFRFRIYTDDKRIKQVVSHSTRLNQAITAVAGVPITRAHITIGGYCDGL